MHGQYHDMVANLEQLPEPSEEDPWLFLGDYVDRGVFGMGVCLMQRAATYLIWIEVVLYLFAMKIKHPTGVYLLRGNHECRHLTTSYNFKKECTATSCVLS